MGMSNCHQLFNPRLSIYAFKIHATRSRADRAVNGNLLFDMLEPAALARVIGSMTPLDVPANSQIIQQGDTVAKNFFVLASGSCEAFLEPNSERPTRQKVFRYTPGT